MTKEELTKRRNKALQNIEEIKVVLSLDEHYIDELEEKIADIKANCDYVLEGKDVEIMELKEHHKKVCENLTNTHRNIREQLTKAKEIIQYLCEMARELSKPNSQFFNVEFSLQEAEQFLKDEKPCSTTLCEDCKFEKCGLRDIGLLPKIDKEIEE
jgi:chromosome segregation ATPase